MTLSSRVRSPAASSRAIRSAASAFLLDPLAFFINAAIRDG